MRTHTGEKPCSCKECGKTLSGSGAVAKHMRTHTGEKLCSCKECGRTFSHRTNLPSHMRTHTREKPYSCKEYMERHYLDVADLQVTWQLTHERPYSHKDCGKKFSQGSPCACRGTRKKQYRCQECGKDFSVLLSSGRHLQTYLRRGTSRQPVKRVCRDKHSSGNHMLKTTCMI